MSVDKTAARNKAQLLLEELKITSAPVPIERIIKRKQIALRYAPFDDEVSGMAYINDGVSIIGVNALHHPNRQRFSAAHELGHHLLHSDTIRQAVHIDKHLRVMLRNEVSSQGTDPQEIEANTFASELLIPRHLLLQELGDGQFDIGDETQVEMLAKRFRVSVSAMSYRLAALMSEQSSA